MRGINLFHLNMFTPIAIIVFLLLSLATVYDLTTRMVPDWIPIVVSLIAVFTSITGLLGLSMLWVLAGGLLGLLIGYALFRFAKFGGADAKLIAAIGTLLGPIGLLIVLLGMGVAGGFLAFVAVLRGQRDYAYVPAIMLGFVGYVGFVFRII